MSRCNGYTRKIRHLVCLDLELLTAERARTGLQHKMEDILGVYRQAAQLCALYIARFGNRPRLVAIAIECKAAQLGGRSVDRIPLKNDRRLCSVATTKCRCRGRVLTEGTKDLGLELVEGFRGLRFGSVVAPYIDVDYAP